MLRRGRAVEAPRFDHSSREPMQDTQTIQPARVIIAEGCYLLRPPLRDQFDVRLFIDTDDHSRFIRRMMRPRRDPSQPYANRLREYCEQFYPGHYQDVAPSVENADIVIPNPYTLEEAQPRLAGELSHQFGQCAVSGTMYEHEHISAGERLTVVSDGTTQKLRYLPDARDLSTGMRFEVPVDQYALNLQRIGYTAIELI